MRQFVAIINLFIAIVSCNVAGMVNLVSSNAIIGTLPYLKQADEKITQSDSFLSIHIKQDDRSIKAYGASMVNAQITLPSKFNTFDDVTSLIAFDNTSLQSDNRYKLPLADLIHLAQDGECNAPYSITLSVSNNAYLKTRYGNPNQTHFLAKTATYYVKKLQKTDEKLKVCYARPLDTSGQGKMQSNWNGAAGFKVTHALNEDNFPTTGIDNISFELITNIDITTDALAVITESSKNDNVKVLAKVDENNKKVIKLTLKGPNISNQNAFSHTRFAILKDNEPIYRKPTVRELANAHAPDLDYSAENWHENKAAREMGDGGRNSCGLLEEWGAISSNLNSNTCIGFSDIWALTEKVNISHLYGQITKNNSSAGLIFVSDGKYVNKAVRAMANNHSFSVINYSSYEGNFPTIGFDGAKFDVTFNYNIESQPFVEANNHIVTATLSYVGQKMTIKLNGPNLSSPAEFKPTGFKIYENSDKTVLLYSFKLTKWFIHDSQDVSDRRCKISL